MGPRQRKHKTKHNRALDRKERDQDTVRAVNQLLETDPVRAFSKSKTLALAHVTNAVVPWPILIFLDL